MMRDYREEIKTYNNVDIQISKSFFGKEIAHIYSDKRKMNKNIRHERAFRNVDVSISDDVRMVSIFNDGKRKDFDVRRVTVHY